MSIKRSLTHHIHTTIAIDAIKYSTWHIFVKASRLSFQKSRRADSEPSKRENYECNMQFCSSSRTIQCNRVLKIDFSLALFFPRFLRERNKGTLSDKNSELSFSFKSSNPFYVISFEIWNRFKWPHNLSITKRDSVFFVSERPRKSYREIGYFFFSSKTKAWLERDLWTLTGDKYGIRLALGNKGAN